MEHWWNGTDGGKTEKLGGKKNSSSVTRQSDTFLPIRSKAFNQLHPPVTCFNVNNVTHQEII
jgi:hypothetical protein